MEKVKIHYTDKYLMSDIHPITVLLIGCGGTGSHVANQLARIHSSLVQLRKKGLDITICDSDTVDQFNIGKQTFSETDIGRFKSDVIATRLNRYYKIDIKSMTTKIYKHMELNYNIIISCVDNLETRRAINFNVQHHQLNHHDKKTYYWIDFGNTNNVGQVIFNTPTEIKQPESDLFKCVDYLPHIFAHYPELIDKKDDLETPSCSMSESLQKQDLFINSMLAQVGCSALWSMLRNGFLSASRYYVNLNNTVSVNSGF